jgi:hypothetical protein
VDAVSTPSRQEPQEVLVLEALSGHEQRELARSTTSGVLQDHLSEHSDDALRLALSTNAALGAEVARRLLSDPSTLVRQGVAMSEAAPEELLRALSTSADPVTRWALAMNPAIPEDVQRVLSVDEEFDVLRALVKNPSLVLTRDLGVGVLKASAQGRSVVEAELKCFDAESRAGFEDGWGGTLAELVEVLEELKGE